MKALRPRYAKIDSTVEELLTKYRVKEPAVPVDTIAKREGASLVYQHFNNEVSGLLLRQGASAIIAVEEEQPPARQRFTIAHELAHLVLHEGKELRVDKQFRVNLRSPASSMAEDVEEIEANAFAAGLLMPETFLIKDLADFVLDIEDNEQVKTLAERYKVSTQAMTLRLANLISRGRV